MGATALLVILASIVFAARTEENLPLGHAIEAGELPYHATIIGHYFYCGGSIIGTRWILTSASCILRAVTPFMYVLTGRVDSKSAQNEYEQTIEVKTIHVHHNFNRTTLENNIALLHLMSPLQFNDYVTHIAIPDQNQNTSSVLALFSGLVHDDEQASSAVWSIVIPTEEEETCKAFHDTNENCFKDGETVYADENFCSITDYSIPFVHYEGGPVVVQLPDNKGPLQTGVISWAKNCTQLFTAYTELNHYADWINDIIHGNSIKISSTFLTFLAALIASYICI